MLVVGCGVLPACSDAASAVQTPVDPVFAIKSWQTKDGLPINNVTAIAQTPEGYIWLGTGNGVVRFDGVRFKSFGLRDGLGSISISKLLVDHTGALWVGTFGGGLSRWNGERFETWSFQDGLAGENISALAEDTEGTLWVGTWTGLSRLRQGKFSTPDGLTNAQVRALGRDSAGAIWVATSPGGLYRLRQGQFLPVAGPAGIDLAGARSLLGDRKGNLWVAMGGQPLLLCLRGEGWRTYGPGEGLPGAAITVLADGADGNLWVGTPNAGLVYLYQGHLVTINQEHGLSSQTVRAVLEDREGNVWVATLFDGLNRLRRARVTAYGPKQGLVADTVNSVVELGDGLLCVGTSEHGLWRQVGLRFEQFLIGDQFRSNAPSVYSVLATQDGDLWCGTVRGLYWWREGQSALAIGLEQFKSVEAVRALCDDGQGGVFAGTALGRVFQARARTLSLVTDQLSGRYVTALLRDAEGALWIGSGGGLYRLRKDDLTLFTTTNGLLSNAIRALYLAPDGSLWIGTAGGGLSLLRNNRFASFTTEHGLPDNIISQIVMDNSGDFWFGCSRGIFRVRQQELQRLAEGKIPFVHPLLLSEADGMPVDLCTGGYSPEAIRRKSGELYFPMIKGLVVVEPNRFKERAVPPRVTLEEVLVDDEKPSRRHSKAQKLTQAHMNPQAEASKATDQAPITSERIVIPPGRHRIEFHYTGLSASAPETINFKYRLQGLEDWVEVGAERVARYRNTPPGHYHFQVLACNLDGIWTDTGPTLAVVVQPYFWQTWWFKGALVLALTACVFGVYEWRLSRAHRARRAQQVLSRSLIESQETERKRIATDLHDSLGQDLMLINNRLSLLVTKESDPADLAKQVSEISQTTMRAISEMRAIAEALRPPDLEHIGITRAIEWMIEKTAGASQTRISAELDRIDSLLKSDQEIHLYRIIQEGINNVLKHSGASRAILEVKHEAANIRVSLFDNGKGFDPPLQQIEVGSRSGIGFSSMSERARVLGGVLDIQSSPGRGTRLTVTVPILLSEASSRSA